MVKIKNWRKIRTTITVPKYKMVRKLVEVPVFKTVSKKVWKKFQRDIDFRTNQSGKLEKLDIDTYDPEDRIFGSRPIGIRHDEGETSLTLPVLKRVTETSKVKVGTKKVWRNVKVQDGVKKKNAPIWINEISGLRVSISLGNVRHWFRKTEKNKWRIMVARKNRGPRIQATYDTYEEALEDAIAYMKSRPN